MSNSFKGNPIFLDDFSSAIDVCASLGFATGTPLKVKSIEWAYPASLNDTALITDKASGRPIFKETCFVAKQNIALNIESWVDNLYIAASGVGSGAILIFLM